MAGQEDPVQREIHQDWANREYIEVITSSIKKIADFLNSFGNKGVSRTERSGRYGPDQGRDDSETRERRERDPEREHERRWSDERRSERYEERRSRDSPERERKRRNSDRSEDGYHSDGDYQEQDFRGEMGEDKESKTIMLRGLPLDVIESDIRAALDLLEGPQPADVRLMKKRTGISRGFAFVEFYHLQDATRWMETNQKQLVVQGKVVALHYSNPRHKFEDWLCSNCGLYNFRRRLKCFRCGAAKVDCESGSSSGLTEAPQGGDYYGDTIILRNIAPLTTVEAIMTALAPYVNLSVGNIRLIKDKQTGHNRGFAFVQLSSPLEASQLLLILQGLQPPLKLDSKTIGVDFAKSARKDLLLPDGNRISAFSVASTAIAAAQWSAGQTQQGSEGATEYSYLQDSYANYSQDYQCYYQQTGALDTAHASALLGGRYNMALYYSNTNSAIAKDMERWAKSLNKQKENFKSSFQPLSQFRDEEKRESAAADAGFVALFEKKQGAFLEKQQQLASELENNEEAENSKCGLVAAYSGDSDTEEPEHEKSEEGTDKLTDWKKMACLLCRRQFPNKDALVRHQQLSDLHKQNLEVHNRSRMTDTELEAFEVKDTEMKYRDRAAERREKYGIPAPPVAKKKKFYAPPSVYVSTHCLK
ncbi:UNVERIFIED_CONTAM: hypothetical protein FKN15_002095 [Acipenser sinensis]